MKKLLTLLLVILTVFILTTSVSAKTVLKGDLNLDGKITAADARGTLRISAKLDKADDTQMIIADVTDDKKITASDARSILRASARLQDAFGEIEIDDTNETETTTAADNNTSKTEVSGHINKNYLTVIDEYDDMRKVGTTDGTKKYTNRKLTIVSDPSIIKDNKISSVIIIDSSYTLNGISVDMTPEKAAETLKKADWIVKSQNTTETVLTKNLMKTVITISDGAITKIEYTFTQSLLSPDETTTTPDETTTKEEVTTEHVHSYKAKVVPPSCEADGYTRFTCEGCSDSYDTDFIKSTGHSAVWVCVTQPQVGKEGLEHFKCRKCNAVLEEQITPALKEEEQEKPEGELSFDQLPAQIKAFMSGNFGIEGYNYSGNTKNPISMYVSPDHVKAGMNINDMEIDMLIRDVNGKKPSVYLVRPDVKEYAKLTALDMGILGISIDDLKIDFSAGTTTPDSIVLSTQTISNVTYTIYTIYTGPEYCKIYMVGENINRIETFETETKLLKTRIDVTTFIASLPADTFTVDQYKKVLTYMSLFI
ncbi:MAG: dockerin type I repeat-containing protein [Clostridia bacterium]|nr:dockerin type I repeat-containing protein [Clostridia bacterium]